MPDEMPAGISPTRVRYIKLGERGRAITCAVGSRTTHPDLAAQAADRLLPGQAIVLSSAAMRARQGLVLWSRLLGVVKRWAWSQG